MNRDISDIGSMISNYCLIDVRAPGEFAHGHIPGAYNVPLFSDELRALVGCVYAQQGKQEAMRVAMQHVGPTLMQLVDQARAVSHGRPLCVYCARGGMRSGAVTWLFSFFQLPVTRLPGGYKAFRNWALAQYSLPRTIQVLGGKTGAGKTDYLRQLAAQGQQMIDLEALAKHKGSVFGGHWQTQATQQQFENDLAVAWAAVDTQRPVWLEDESRKIGSVIIPEPVWVQMQAAPLFVLETPRPMRLERIMTEYGALDELFIRDALTVIKQQLGGVLYQEVCVALDVGDRLQAADLLLAYYDRKYAYGLRKKSRAHVAVRPY